MIKAVLFDIDNTLILFNEHKFMEGYLPSVFKEFSDILEQEEFFMRIMNATKQVAMNNGEIPNDEYFLRIFSQGKDWSYSDIWGRFENYYDTKFESFKSVVEPAPGAGELFSEIKRKNLKIVLASNPLWPENVQLMRAEWAGFKDCNFAFVSHISNMRYCKPDVKFFEHICDEIDTAPEHCLMVGNDEIQDMSAKTAGMKTFLTFDGKKYNNEFFLQNYHSHLKGNVPKPDYSGSLLDVVNVINSIAD